MVKENFKMITNNVKLNLSLDNFREPESVTKQRKVLLSREK